MAAPTLSARALACSRPSAPSAPAGERFAAAAAAANLRGRIGAGTGPLWQDATPAARQHARSLAVPHQAAPTGFDPECLRHLPEPAQRWLSRAIAPATPLPSAVELRLRGQIRLGRWRRFTATELLVPDSGFVWSARTRTAGVSMRGFDAYAQGRGLTDWRLSRLLSMQTDSDCDSMGAIGRLAAESVLVPSVLLGATWRRRPEPDSATFVRALGEDRQRVGATVRVRPDGRLAGVRMFRWGKPEGEPFGLRRFEIDFDSELEVGGICIGNSISAAWRGEDGRRHEFYRATIEAARFLGTLEQPSPRRGRTV